MRMYAQKNPKFRYLQLLFGEYFGATILIV